MFWELPVSRIGAYPSLIMILAVSFLFAACSATSTPLLSDLADQQPPQADSPAQIAAALELDATGDPATSSPPVELRNDLIIGFKHRTVVLYASPTSNNGERVPADTVATPLRPRASANQERVEIMTIDGPRWISKSEVIFGPSA